MKQNFASYENLIYIVIDNKMDSDELTDGPYGQLIRWSKSVISKEIKNFYLIYVQSKVCLCVFCVCLWVSIFFSVLLFGLQNIDQDSIRIRKIVVYLSKELPAELSGQIFFI